MATQPAKVRYLYQELKRFYGGEFSAGELLRCAAKFVELIDIVNDVEGEFLRSTDSRSTNPSLDVAFSDGGWSLLNREKAWVRQCFEDSTTQDFRLKKADFEMEISLFPPKGTL